MCEREKTEKVDKVAEVLGTSHYIVLSLSDKEYEDSKRDKVDFGMNFEVNKMSAKAMIYASKALINLAKEIDEEQAMRAMVSLITGSSKMKSEHRD